MNRNEVTTFIEITEQEQRWILEGLRLLRDHIAADIYEEEDDSLTGGVFPYPTEHDIDMLIDELAKV